MQDVSKLSDAELEVLREGLNAKREAIVAELRAVTSEQSVRLARAKVGAVLAGLTPAQRAALKAQTLAPPAVASGEVLGAPGAA